jgi:hypothetical protein
LAIHEVIAQIDAEIAKLEQAKSLLSGGSVAAAPLKGRRGRPPSIKNAVKAIAPAKAKKVAKRVLSPEARAKIAAAQKARWASAKEATG